VPGPIGLGEEDIVRVSGLQKKKNVAPPPFFIYWPVWFICWLAN